MITKINNQKMKNKTVYYSMVKLSMSKKKSFKISQKMKKESTLRRSTSSKSIPITSKSIWLMLRINKIRKAKSDRSILSTSKVNLICRSSLLPTKSTKYKCSVYSFHLNSVSGWMLIRWCWKMSWMKNRKV